MNGALAQFDASLAAAKSAAGNAPACSFSEFLSEHARVRLRDGSYGAYSFAGRAPLEFVAELLDKIIRNCKHGEAVEIDGITYQPGKLKGATLAICGGAQFGKTVLELNFGGWLTTVELLNFGFYTSDVKLLDVIVDTKFRPDVVDQVAWMPDMISLGKGQSRSGKSVNKKNAFQCTAADGRTSFGYFNGMQKPPTTISLDVAALDEVDDIPERNIGFISGRMTNSDVQLTCYIGTQRVHAAGQNARWLKGTMHRFMHVCPECGAKVCLEEHWPQICRVASAQDPLLGGVREAGGGSLTDPVLSETMTYNPQARYYPACLECGAELDRDAGAFEAEHPERAGQLNWSVRVSQFACSALSWQSIVAAWFAALSDPNPDAMSAWHCDRRAIPNAGAAQPITPGVLARARSCALAATPEDAQGAQPYSMQLVSNAAGALRVAGMDMGPRCWLAVNELASPLVRPLAWAEMVASGNAFARCVELYAAGAFSVLFLDAGGEPDLTKRIVLALNKLDSWSPPVVPQSELRKMRLCWPHGMSWDGERSLWKGIRAAAVAFSLREAGGVQQDIGFTQDGRIYPLIKCCRSESIQSFVNEFLTPAEGVIQQVEVEGKLALRLLPRQRLPENCLGAGVTQSVLDTHLANLRRERDPRTGREDWVDQVENHLGLAGVYAHLAATSGVSAPRRPFEWEGTMTAEEIEEERAVLL